MFTLIYVPNLHIGKGSTGGLCALIRETRLDQFQLARPPPEKSQKAVAPRDTKMLLGRSDSYGLGLVRRFSPLVLSLIIRRLSRR